MRSIRIFAKNMGDPYYEPTIVVHDTLDTTILYDVICVQYHCNHVPAQHHTLSLCHDVLPHHLDISLLPKIYTFARFHVIKFHTVSNGTALCFTSTMTNVTNFH